MSFSHIENVKMLIVCLADYYRDTLTDNQICMYAEDLEDLSLEQLKKAIMIYRAQNSSGRFPLPAALKSLLTQKVTAKDLALETIEKIKRAVSNRGWNWSDGYYSTEGKYFVANDGSEKKYFADFSDALEFELGTFGAEVIRNRGGWRVFCEELNSDRTNKESFFAQLRDACAEFAQRDAFKQASASRDSITRTEMEIKKSSDILDLALKTSKNLRLV